MYDITASTFEDQSFNVAALKQLPWSSGQRARLKLHRFEFYSGRRLQEFFCKIVYEIKEINKKRGRGWPIEKTSKHNETTTSITLSDLPITTALKEYCNKNFCCQKN